MGFATRLLCHTPLISWPALDRAPGGEGGDWECGWDWHRQRDDCFLLILFLWARAERSGRCGAGEGRPLGLYRECHSWLSTNRKVVRARPSPRAPPLDESTAPARPRVEMSGDCVAFGRIPPPRQRQAVIASAGCSRSRSANQTSNGIPLDGPELVKRGGRSSCTLAHEACGSVPRGGLPLTARTIESSGGASGPTRSRFLTVKAPRRGCEFGTHVASLPIRNSQYGKRRVLPAGANPFRRKPARALCMKKALSSLVAPPTVVNVAWPATNQMRPFPPDSTTAWEACACVCSSRAWKVLEAAFQQVTLTSTFCGVERLHLIMRVRLHAHCCSYGYESERPWRCTAVELVASTGRTEREPRCVGHARMRKLSEIVPREGVVLSFADQGYL